MPIVTDDGFHEEPPRTFLSPDDLSATGGDGLAVLVDGTADPEALVPRFTAIDVIAVDFPVFSDGRGFSLAARLRALGYRGRLRARGHVIVDQYRHARAAGFDEVEIDEGLATRQPEDAWRRAAARPAPLYRARRVAAGCEPAAGQELG